MQTHYKHWLLASMLLLLVLLLPLGPSYAEAPEPRFALHPVEKDGLYGYANDAGELVIPHQWQYAGQFRGAGYAAVNSGRGKWAIITTDGEYVFSDVEAIYDQHQLYYPGGMHNGVFWLEAEGRFGFMDVNTGYFSGYLYDDMQDLWPSVDTDLIRVTEDGIHYRYVHHTDGSLAYPMVFTGIERSSGGCVLDSTDGGLVVLDDLGNAVPIPDGLDPVIVAGIGDPIVVRSRDSGLYGFCSYTGECIIPPRYTKAEVFEKGYAAVQLNDQWGVIDMTGQLCPVPLSDQPATYNGRSFLVHLEHSTLLVEPDGTVLRELPETAGIQITDELLLIGRDGHHSLMDRDGNMLVTEERGLWFGSAGMDLILSEGLMLVKNEQGLYGYVNTAGELVGSCIWEDAEPFSNGWARVCKDGAVYYIDRNMQIVYPSEREN